MPGKVIGELGRDPRIAIVRMSAIGDVVHVLPVVASLRASTAPFLLIGGTADTAAWDGALARSLTPYVCEIPDANHGLMVPAGLAASAGVLGEVTTATERFLDEVVWPA